MRDEMNRAVLQAKIIAAYRTRAAGRGAPVALADIRDALADVPEREMDRAFSEMAAYNPSALFTPDRDPRLLPSRVAASAAGIRGELCHWLSIS
jgi:hypothetical protein